MNSQNSQFQMQLLTLVGELVKQNSQVLEQNNQLIQQNNQLIQINNEQNAQINELLIQIEGGEEDDKPKSQYLDG